MQRLLDEVARGGGDPEYEGEFEGDCNGGDERGRPTDTDFNGGWHYDLGSGSSDTEEQGSSGTEAANARKRGQFSFHLDHTYAHPFNSD
ncbi:hypothetical protein JCM5350_001174 [Sporobolomyces pararoseus]